MTAPKLPLRPAAALAAALLLLTPGVAARQSAAMAATPAAPSAAALAEVDRYFREQAAADAFSGAVLIAHDGHTLFERGYGLANGLTGEPVIPDTRFNLASVDKFITRIAIFQLMESGKLGLDDKVGDLLPAYPNQAVREKVTVADLLFMRAGIPSFWNERFFARRASLVSTDDYLALFADEPLRFEPGSRREYSNGGYVLLGKIVEQLSGMSYGDYVRRHIAGPAGMSNTSLDPTGKIAVPYTRGRPDGSTDPAAPLRWRADFGGNRGSAAGGGYSTVRDFARLDRALRAGKLLGRAGAEQLLGREFRRGVGPAVGWAGGSAGGASARIAMLVDGTTIIVFTNRDSGLAERTSRRVGELLGKTLTSRGPFV